MAFRRAFSDKWCLWRYPELAESFDIESHLTHRERVQLFRLASRAGVDAIVEVGSYLGASAAAFGAGLAHVANQGARIYCIDTWNNDAMSEGQRDTMASFLENTRSYRSSIVPTRGWSTDVAPTIATAARQIDLLFIDGDHSFQGCLADWQAYAPLLRPGAQVAFHDVGWAEGVQQVITTHVRPRVKHEARLPNLWWGQLA